MKKINILYKFVFSSVFIFSAGFIGFIATALVMREKQKHFDAWFLIAGFCLLLGVLSLWLLVKIINSEKYKRNVQIIRQKKFELAKRKNKIKSYYLGKEFNSIKELLNKSVCFESKVLTRGEIFYKTNKSLYNKKCNSFDVFYLLDSVVNSYENSREKVNVQTYAKDLIDYLNDKYGSAEFINCVFIFQENSLAESQKEFYYNFSGVWNSTIEEGSFVINHCFTYCGIDLSNNQICFYQPLKSDVGDEVDLKHMISKELNIT